VGVGRAGSIERSRLEWARRRGRIFVDCSVPAVDDQTRHSGARRRHERPLAEHSAVATQFTHADEANGIETYLSIAMPAGGTWRNPMLGPWHGYGTRRVATARTRPPGLCRLLGAGTREGPAEPIKSGSGATACMGGQLRQHRAVIVLVSSVRVDGSTHHRVAVPVGQAPSARDYRPGPADRSTRDLDMFDEPGISFRRTLSVHAPPTRGFWQAKGTHTGDKIKEKIEMFVRSHDQPYGRRLRTYYGN